MGRKTTVWTIQATNKRNLRWENLDMAKKRSLKRENESLLIAAQNNAIRSNYVKAKIDKTQQNSRCWLCGDRDETIKHIISECSKLTQRKYKKYTTRWGRWSTGNCAISLKVTIRTNGICTTQNPSWKMRHKILWDFETQADHLISARQPNLVIVKKKKKKLPNSELCLSGWPQGKIERKRKERYVHGPC